MWHLWNQHFLGPSFQEVHSGKWTAAALVSLETQSSRSSFVGLVYCGDTGQAHPCMCQSVPAAAAASPNVLPSLPEEPDVHEIPHQTQVL